MGDFNQVVLNPLISGETKKRGGLDFRVYQDLKTGIQRRRVRFPLGSA